MKFDREAVLGNNQHQENSDQDLPSVEESLPKKPAKIVRIEDPRLSPGNALETVQEEGAEKIPASDTERPGAEMASTDLTRNARFTSSTRTRSPDRLGGSPSLSRQRRAFSLAIANRRGSISQAVVNVMNGKKLAETDEDMEFLAHNAVTARRGSLMEF